MITALKYMAYNFAILKLLGTTRQNRSELGQNWSEPCLNRAQWTRIGQPWAGFSARLGRRPLRVSIEIRRRGAKMLAMMRPRGRPEN